MRSLMVFLIFFGLTGIGCAVTPDPNFVGDCRPCSVLIKPNHKFLFYYDTTQIDDETLVKTIRVTTPDGRLIQIMDVKEMVPVLELDELFLGLSDVNFDDAEDIYFITSRGASNAYANYWIFDSHVHKFVPAGVFPVFTVHPESKTLSTHENLGSGGREYIKRVYRAKNRTIEPIYEEKQVKDPKTGKFRVEKKGRPNT